MRKAALILTTALLLGGAATWFLVFRVDTGSLILEGLPPRPKDSPVSAALADKLDNAESDIRNTKSAGAMAELSRLYHANGYFAEASQCYATLMEVEPRNAQWPHLAAMILAGYGQLEDAIPLEKLSIELAPTYTPSRIRLGDMLLKSNRVDEAESAYTAVLKEQPEHPYALQGMARVQIARGEWAKALPHLQAAADKSNGSVGYDLIVDAYERTGRADLARGLRARQKASGAYYDIPDPWHDAMFIACLDPYRATIASGSAARAGDMETALRLLDHVITISPKYALAYYHRGILHKQMGNLPRASADFERSGELDPTYSDTWVKLVSLYEEQGDNLGAELTVEKGLSLCPDSPSLNRFKAVRLAKKGRLKEADSLFLKVIKVRPDEVTSYSHYAHFLINNNRVEDAIGVLHRGLAAEPEEPGILSTLAMYAIYTRNEPEARQWMRRMENQPRTQPESFKSLKEQFRQAFQKAY